MDRGCQVRAYGCVGGQAQAGRWDWGGGRGDGRGVEYDGGKRDGEVDGTGDRIRDMGIQVCS
jgi:hypothetical protein